MEDISEGDTMIDIKEWTVTLMVPSHLVSISPCACFSSFPNCWCSISPHVIWSSFHSSLGKKLQKFGRRPSFKLITLSATNQTNWEKVKGSENSRCYWWYISSSNLIDLNEEFLGTSRVMGHCRTICTISSRFTQKITCYTYIYRNKNDLRRMNLSWYEWW